MYSLLSFDMASDDTIPDPDDFNLESFIHSLNQKLVHGNGNLVEKLLIDVRDDKDVVETLTETGEDWNDRLSILMPALRGIAVKRYARASDTISLGVFILLGGMAIHLINPSGFSVSVAGILASCALVIGILRIIKGISDRKKYALILKNLDRDSQNIKF